MSSSPARCRRLKLNDHADGKHFLFIELPRELRDQVYYSIMAGNYIAVEQIWRINDEPTPDERSHKMDGRRTRAGGIEDGCALYSITSQPCSLLFVSRQMHAEFFPYLYGTPIAFNTAATIIPFFRNQPERALRYVKQVSISTSFDEDAECWEAACRYLGEKLRILELTFTVARPSWVYNNPIPIIPWAERNQRRLRWQDSLAQITGLNRFYLVLEVISVYHGGPELKIEMEDRLKESMLKR